jgi:hypothetical protein
MDGSSHSALPISEDGKTIWRSQAMKYSRHTKRKITQTQYGIALKNLNVRGQANRVPALEFDLGL